MLKKYKYIIAALGTLAVLAMLICEWFYPLQTTIVAVSIVLCVAVFDLIVCLIDG